MTRENFDHVMPHVRVGLQQCLFYSFDCEFSGISATSKPLDYYASMQERYGRVRPFCTMSMPGVVFYWVCSSFGRVWGLKSRMVDPAVLICVWGVQRPFSFSPNPDQSGGRQSSCLVSV